MQKNVIYENGELLLDEMPTIPTVITQVMACANYVEFVDDGTEVWLPPQIVYSIELEPNTTYLVTGSLLNLTHDINIACTLNYRFYLSGGVADYNITGLNIAKDTSTSLIQQFALIDNSETDYFATNSAIRTHYSNIYGTLTTADSPTNVTVRIYMEAIFAVSANIGDQIWSNATQLNKLLLTKLECVVPTPAEEEEMIVVKTSDTSVISDNTTWNNDADLIMALDANSKYIFEGLMYISNSDATNGRAVDYKALIPTGATGYGTAQWFSGTENDYPRIIVPNIWDLTNDTTALFTQSKTGYILVKGSVITGITTGNIQLSWKPSVNHANNMTLKTGSYLKIIKQV